MRDTVIMPKSYQDLMKMLVDGEASAVNEIETPPSTSNRAQYAGS